MRNGGSSWQTAANVYVVAVVFNYLWEMGQAVLFTPWGSLMQGIWRCFVASLGDGVLVLLIFAVGWIALGGQGWIETPGLRGYALMITTGLAIAMTIEWIALQRGRWSYQPAMPVIPILEVGLAPVLQMIVLPPLVFKTAVWWQRHKRTW